MLRNGLTIGMLAMAAASQAFVWDDFTDGDASMVLSSGNQSMETAASVPGGFRDLSLIVLTNQYGGNASERVSHGEFTHNNDAGVLSQANLQYGNGSGGMHFDMLGQGGSLRFVFDQIDLGINLNIRAFTGNNISGWTQDLTATGTAENIDISFSSFTGSANFHNIDHLYIQMVESTGHPYGSDVALSQISIVPEPASIAAIAIGCLGLWRWRRR